VLAYMKMGRGCFRVSMCSPETAPLALCRTMLAQCMLVLHAAACVTMGALPSAGGGQDQPLD
jgi:hypothetical protein